MDNKKTILILILTAISLVLAVSGCTEDKIPSYSAERVSETIDNRTGIIETDPVMSNVSGSGTDVESEIAIDAAALRGNSSEGVVVELTITNVGKNDIELNEAWGVFDNDTAPVLVSWDKGNLMLKPHETGCYYLQTGATEREFFSGSNGTVRLSLYLLATNGTTKQGTINEFEGFVPYPKVGEIREVKISELG